MIQQLHTIRCAIGLQQPFGTDRRGSQVDGLSNDCPLELNHKGCSGQWETSKYFILKRQPIDTCHAEVGTGSDITRYRVYYRSGQFKPGGQVLTPIEAGSVLCAHIKRKCRYRVVMVSPEYAMRQRFPSAEPVSIELVLPAMAGVQTIYR